MATALEAGTTNTVFGALAAQLRGAVIASDDGAYDAARRVWNGMIDRRPQLIVRCAGVADVIASVNFARENGLPVSIRGGAHNVAGNAVAEGGLMIDLSGMKGIHVDPRQKTVRAEPGVLWGELDHETQAFGLATTGGQVSHTGIAGLTLGGGIGNLMRKYGCTVDNLLSVDIVTADGELRHASATENANLFWGVRGGGGNFGVVTSFEYRLHAVGPMVTGGLLIWPAAEAAGALRAYRDRLSSAPDDLTATFMFMTAPPAPFVPPEFHGAPVAAMLVCHLGSPEDAEKDIAPLRAFGPPALDMVGPIPYVAIQQIPDAGASWGFQVYTKSAQLTGLDDDAIDVLVAHAAEMTSPLSVVVLPAMGGAVSRVGVNDTAFNHRHSPYHITIFSLWTDPVEAQRHIDWTRRFAEALQPFTAGVYVNELGNEGEDRIKAAYTPETYQRLVAVKNEYDPTNVFRVNQNIKPTG
ncbi:MAG: FAD-binding oxidoreductase [Chloroflexota bacterium]